MPGLQSLLASFVTTTNGYTRNGETVFQHPHTQTRIALAADVEAIQGLATFGWTVSDSTVAASFSVLPALQRIFPALQSQHPDQLAKLVTPDTVAQLIEAQPVEHRGRMARWLLVRSRSTGNAELAKWTRDACAELPIQADHPLAPTPVRPTYLQGPDTVARITGNELSGYKLLLVATSNGRTMLSSAPTLDELWTPNSEWTTAQWNAYEQLLRATPCEAPAFTAHVDTPHADAASHTQHLWAIEQGTAAYLGNATDALRRRFRHTPSSQWLDSASAETGISLQSASGMNRLIDLFMVEHLDESTVLQYIVPAMREADSDFAELSDTALAAIWRSAYNPILNSVQRANDDKVRLRVGEAPPVVKSSVETMRGLLSSYYGVSPIATLELAGKLHLVESVDDLPPNLRDEVDLHGGRDRVSGMEYEKSVYLIGANTAPDTVCSVFLHEVGEHAALHTMLGRDYGRIVQRFNKLLSEGDTYAVQASMMVPSTTAPSNLNSEHLAHLIQLTADDLEAKDGGAGGFDLGQRCIRDLRTWLYRTPLMRELERQGELEDFKLEAHDIATLAREAVDFYVADHQHSTTALNQWDSKLDGELVAAMHKMSVEQRIEALQTLSAEQQVAYLYALGTMQAPHGHETLTQMAGVIAEATNSPDDVTRLIANEVSALTLRLATQSRASRRLDDHGLFVAISGTHDPASSVLTLIRAAEHGQWVAEHYQAGLGLTLREEFESKEAAIQILGQHHFPVQQNELDSVIARWGSAVAAEHRQLDSQAFQRWFDGSVTRHSDGSPIVMYHGTAKNFSQANGIFWASAPTPAELRPEPAPATVPTPTAPNPFESWFADSKIVDAHGKPLTLYHGTSASFNAFKVSPYGAIGAGVYTTPYAGEAQIYGDRLIDLHASLTNPLIGTFAEIRAMQYANETSERFTERLIGLGYDGVATKDATGGFDYVVAFDPSQLKSASQNNGMYDRSNTDIRFRSEAPLRSPTETLAFANWFDGSKIVDAQGQPLVVYHGTGDDFTAFKAGPSYFSPRMDYSYVRNSDVVMPVYLNIQNPYRPASQHEIESIRSNTERYEELKAQGYDGMIWSMPDNIMKGASGWGNDLPQIVAFYPNQLKSAIGNAGTFDRASDDIRFKSFGGEPQTSLPAFQKWFGDSKVISSGGVPLVVYHGTAGSFYEFKAGRGGFYFTDDEHAASAYAQAKVYEGEEEGEDSGPRVISAYLSIENPLILDRTWYNENVLYDGEPDWEVVDREVYNAEMAGHDGLILRGFEDYYGLKDGKRIEHVYDQYIAFRPEQIKSADSNAGSFDRASPDIRFDMPGITPQIEQSAFNEWFGQSRLVDAGGAPLVLYHGTNKDFTEFDSSAVNSRFPFSFGFHFTDSRDEASVYADSVTNAAVDFNPTARFGIPPMEGGNIMPVFLRAENPLVIHTDQITASIEADVNREQILTRLEDAIAAGSPYDSVIIKRERGDEYDGINVIVFDPTQIKSATGNAGTFDRHSADIRFKNNGQLPQTSLPSFQSWFVRSRVVTTDGAPLVVYHGSHQDFTVFQQQDGAHIGFHFGNQVAANTRLDDTTEKHFDNDEYIRLNERASMFYMDLRAFNTSLEEKSANTSPETILADSKRLGKEIWEIIGDYAYQPTPDELAKRKELETRFNEANVLVHKYGTGSHINAFYLSIQRPLRLPDVGDWGTPDTVARELPWGSDAETFEEIVAEIKDHGFDGIVYHNKVENMAGELADSYIAFDPEQIKSAIGNVGTFDKESADVRFAFAGAGANTASRPLLASAKAAIEEGGDAEQVRKDTGWFQGSDDKWRFELDDSQLTARDSWNLWGQNTSAQTFRLHDLIDHWSLFDAYPELRYMSVTVEPGLPPDHGMFRPLDNSITIGAEPEEGLLNLSDQQLSALMHEVQHGIQEIENFAHGGSSSDTTLLPSTTVLKNLNAIYTERKIAAEQSTEYAEYLEQVLSEIPAEERMREGARGEYDHGMKVALQAAYDRFLDPIEAERLAMFDRLLKLGGPLQGAESRMLSYRLLAGEVEARNVQERLRLTAPERVAMSPQSTQDAPEESVYLWHEDEVRLASLVRAQNDQASALPAPSAKLRFAYSDNVIRAQMEALANFYTQSGEYQFEQYEERERITDQLIEHLADNDQFLGMVLPVGFGFSTLTQSAKQPGAWQVTALDASFVPLSDEGTQSKREALATFFAQFDTASAAAVITGTTADIQIANTHPGVSKSLKGSMLADEYAEMRQDVAKYSQPVLEADRALVMPVYLSAKAPFDADKLPPGSLKVGQLRDELVRQAEASGRHIDVMFVGSLVKTITKAARLEESGPYYRAHDFWANPTSFFGGAGAAALEQLFSHCGFDSIKLTERDHLTYGVFSSAQVKSASGNSGLFSANPDIRFTFAGANALTSDVSRLKQAKQLAEQDEPTDSIWRQTGWMVGTDGEWRFEIDDSKARVRGFDYDKNEPEVTTSDPERYMDWVDESIHSRDGVPLGQFYDHPELYAAYPMLAHLKVVAVERSPGDTAYGSLAFYPSFAKSKLFVAAPYTLSNDGPTVEEILSHETQHAIQHLEGFGPGAISSDFDGELSANENLKSNMRAYVEIHDQSMSLGCEPEKFAELSGHEPLMIERIGTWRQQGNWESNVASFRRNLMSPYDLYFHEAGEVEARNTAHRLGMDVEQRANAFPLDTIDVESSLVRVTRKIRVFADSSTGPETTAFSRADCGFEWATKTHSWRSGLNDNAKLIHVGDSINLFSVQSVAASREGFGEVFAVTLDDTVVGSFLYGPADAGQHLNAAAMVHPNFRRQGIASAAYDAIERVTGLSLAPSTTKASDSANAFWSARQTSTSPDKAVGDSDALRRWLRNSTTVGADGKPTVFYHGTQAAFRNFDAARHRSILNNKYQGDAFNFTPSAAVASKYATAARNQQFRQHDLFAAADKALPTLASRLLKGLVEEGFPTWEKYSPQDMQQLIDTCISAGFDLNDLVDLSQHVEGSASAWLQEDYNLFADHHNSDMPDDIKDLAVSLGLTDAVPTPIVMPVYLRCENTLFTDDRQQAREAQSKGYDSVCYSGEGTVDQEPEWMVFSSHNIRSVFEFEQDAKVFMQEHNRPMATPASAPITPPASTQFDHWFEGSSCINQFAEPRLVFVLDNAGHPFSTFTDLNAASADDKGRVTPAILAIRSPFVVTDSAHVSITDLNDKLGNRKAGLIVGELLSDGRVFIQDIIENPRYDKWLKQAGYDGAIYRNRDGENRYVTCTPTQALVGTAVAPDLTGTVHWGQIQSAAPLTFTGDRARARQFTLSNHGKPHGHVVPMNAADQYLGASDRLYVNHLSGTRLTAASITTLCENPATSGQLRDFLTLYRKALAGKARIEDTFADHIRTLRQDINQTRQEARADTPQANHHRKMVDKLSNALAWAVEQSSSGKSFKGLVSEDLLQWNQPLSQQSALVQKALSTLGIDGLYQVEGNGIPQLKTCNRYTAAEFAREYHDGKVVKLDGARLTGRACYEELANDLGGSKQAAHLLASMGITGAQQSNTEVLLFKPEYNHEPLVAMAMCKSSPGALDGDTLAIHDIGGVLLKGGVHSACKSLWSNQERALEVAQSAINLLAARQAQQGEFASPLAANDVHNKLQLAEARALQQDLMFSSTPRQFLPWDQPPTEQQLKALAPVIQLDPAHALPGSAVFRLIAGRQEGIEGAKAMLSKAGFVGVTSQENTLAWGSGAEKVLRTVASDLPRQDFTILPEQVESTRSILTMNFG